MYCVLLKRRLQRDPINIWVLLPIASGPYWKKKKHSDTKILKFTSMANVYGFALYDTAHSVAFTSLMSLLSQLGPHKMHKLTHTSIFHLFV